MTDTSRRDSSNQEGATGGTPLVGTSETDDLIYRSLQAWSRPHPAEGVVTVHFATRERPERRFTLTAAAARDPATRIIAAHATPQTGPAREKSEEADEQT